jgi:hypothetical protein
LTGWASQRRSTVARSVYSAHHSDAGCIRAIERLYSGAEFDAYRELGSASVGLTMKNGELELLT